MVLPVKAGDEVLIPLFNAETVGAASNVQWQQNLAQRKADYYAITADNITTGETFPLFIAAEYYKNSTKANPKHVANIGELVEGEGYKVKIDDNFQYGQKNAEGELRFVVYHDKERKPYQHRFIETAVGSAAGNKAKDIAKAFGASDVGDAVHNLAKNFVGDYLHTF